MEDYDFEQKEKCQECGKVITVFYRLYAMETLCEPAEYEAVGGSSCACDVAI